MAHKETYELTSNCKSLKCGRDATLVHHFNVQPLAFQMSKAEDVSRLYAMCRHELGHLTYDLSLLYVKPHQSLGLKMECEIEFVKENTDYSHPSQPDFHVVTFVSNTVNIFRPETFHVLKSLDATYHEMIAQVMLHLLKHKKESMFRFSNLDLCVMTVTGAADDQTADC